MYTEKTGFAIIVDVATLKRAGVRRAMLLRVVGCVEWYCVAAHSQRDAGGGVPD